MEENTFFPQILYKHSSASKIKLKFLHSGASLVAQWLRIRLPMQGTQVRALVQEDPTCHGVTKPMCHNYWACTLEPTSHNHWTHVPQLLKPVHLEPVLRNKRSHHNEKPMHCNKEWSLLATTRESPHTATKTRHSQKKKFAFQLFWLHAQNSEDFKILGLKNVSLICKGLWSYLNLKPPHVPSYGT